MTGKYQQRFGFECNPERDFPGLDTDQRTIAEALKTEGYTTAAFGKWHLGSLPGTKPNERGFDHFWGFLSGSRSYFPYLNLEKASPEHRVRENDSLVTFEGYLTDVLAEKCTDFIHKNREQPFFIYWSPNAVHTPMQAKSEDLERYEGHSRQELAAMTWSLDQAVGNIVDQLERDALLDNTLIFFLSDNGGAHNNQSSCYPLKGFKGNKFEGGHRVPFFIHWPAKFKGAEHYDGLTSSLDIFTTALSAAGAGPEEAEVDGIDLLPYICEENPEAEPHKDLYWRKDAHAAARIGDHKLIRVRGHGSVLYDLSEDIGEQNDLSHKQADLHQDLISGLENWESGIEDPDWIEAEKWNMVTMEIHTAMMDNREPRYKNPWEMKSYISANKD
jgi:arylsulfatase A-like enzyme